MPRRAMVLLSVFVLIILGVGVLCIHYATRTTPAQRFELMLADAEQALKKGRLDDAEAQCRLLTESYPSNAPGWLLRAKVAEELDKWSVAREYYQYAATVSESVVKGFALNASGRVTLKHLRWLSAAEADFREALKVTPSDINAANLLAQLLAISGRYDELETVLVDIIRLGGVNNFYLAMLVESSATRQVNPEELRQFEPVVASDVEAATALARDRMLNSQPEDALRRIEGVLRKSPATPRAQLILGELLLAKDLDQFDHWSSSNAESLVGEIGYWRLISRRVAQGTDQLAIIRANWEIVRRNPNDRNACYQLGRALMQAKLPDVSYDAFLERARLLGEYEAVVAIAKTGDRMSIVENAIERADQLGLVWEALGWNQLILQKEPENAGADARMPALQKRCRDADSVRTLASANPAKSVDFSHIQITSLEPVRSAKNLHDLAVNIGFRNDAHAVGVDFQYVNGGRPSETGIQHMFELTGGGVGAIDFDRDGWPDCYFTQGCRWEERGYQKKYYDALFRNQDGKSFKQVAELARIQDAHFGQGVSVGDFNNDGFPDVLVANVGGGRLYQNLGDGTFSEAGELAAFEKDEWGTSCVIADVTGDSIPDIVIVNYLGGDDVFTRICPDTAGRRRLSCRPHYFAASVDRFLAGDGVGGVIDVSEKASFRQPDGRGLGVVVGRFRNPSRPFVYVANDGSANYLFNGASQLESGSSLPMFREGGVAAGVGLDFQGRAQASMGIAADDYNGDGRLDFFVTNFTGETNTLYSQTADGVFTDITDEVGLAAPSRPMLGFGTQFLDANLDGYPDLVVANGHVNDVRDGQTEYQMRPQFFCNQRGVRFVECVRKTSPGDYFDTRRLGRGLAVLDWNGDGRPDFVVTHLDSPSALLTNTTADMNNWLGVRLVGTVSSRDAIGATVTVRAGERDLARQLTAGDGYQASNERRLTFGLEQHAAPLSVAIDWPSGRQQVVSNVACNQVITVIEPSE